MSHRQHPPSTEEPSTADLIRRLSEQTSTLLRQELELAKVELTEKGKQAGIGVGMFGGAGLAALYAVGLLLTAIVAALSLAMATWLAALIVAVVLGAIAGVLALQGRNRVQQATPPTPEAAIDTTKTDVQVLKGRAQDGRSAR